MFLQNVNRSVVSDSVRPHGLWPARLLCPWGFSRQEYWSELPFPPPTDLPDPGIEPRWLASPASAGRSFIPSTTWDPLVPPTLPLQGPQGSITPTSQMRKPRLKSSEDEKFEAKRLDSRSPDHHAILPLQTHLDKSGFSPWSPGTGSNTHTGKEGSLSQRTVLPVQQKGTGPQAPHPCHRTQP